MRPLGGLRDGQAVAKVLDSWLAQRDERQASDELGAEPSELLKIFVGT